MNRGKTERLVATSFSSLLIHRLNCCFDAALPFSVIENSKKFKQFLSYLQPSFVAPSADSVGHLLDGDYANIRKEADNTLRYFSLLFSPLYISTSAFRSWKEEWPCKNSCGNEEKMKSRALSLAISIFWTYLCYNLYHFARVHFRNFVQINDVCGVENIDSSGLLLDRAKITFSRKTPGLMKY